MLHVYILKTKLKVKFNMVIGPQFHKKTATIFIYFLLIHSVLHTEVDLQSTSV